MSMDEELAQTIGAELHAKITEHLGKLKEAYGEDLNQKTVLFERH